MSDARTGPADGSEGLDPAAEMIEKHADGTVASRVPLAGGVPHGEATFFDAGGGGLLRRCTYKNGVLDGPCEILDGKGNLQQRAAFKDGVLEGESVIHGPDGAVTQRARFAGGQLEGEAVIYNQGRVQARLTYRQGVLDGLAQHYDEAERRIGTCEYKGGKKNGPAVWFDAKGRVVKKESFKDDRLHGETVEYYPEDDRVREKRSYVMDKLDGELVRYFPNGKTHEILRFKAGKQVGPKIEYDQKGRMVEPKES